MPSKILIQLTLLICSLTLPVVSAEAQGGPGFSSSRSSFADSFDNFNRELGSTGDRMKQVSIWMNSETAKRQIAESQSNFLNNGYPAQDQFANGQAQSLNSGGNYNTPGRTMPYGTDVYPPQH